LGARADVMDILPNFDLLCFTSIWDEPFGITILESLRCGVPVIAFKGGAISEILQHQANGEIITPSVEALSSAILRLKADHEKRARYISNGLMTVEARFSMDAMLNKLSVVYSKI